jgi:4'-phosphopantetheinyl transferase
MRVLWARIDAPWCDALAARAAAQVPAAIVARASRYRAARDGQEIVLGRLLLAANLERAGGALTLADVALTAEGRPVLPQGDCSIAHADGFVVCALCESGRVGIDVERLRPDDVDDYNAVFSPAERALIAASPDPGSALLRAWTLKEAEAKAAGSGLTAALPDLAGPRPLAYAGRHWHLRQHDQSGFALGLATDRLPPAVIPLTAMRLGADGLLQAIGDEAWT